MKRWRLLTFALGLITLLALSGQVQARSDSQGGASTPGFELPPNAVQVAHGVYDLGYAVDNGRLVRGYAFLHPRNGNAKPDGTPGGGNGNGKGGGKGDSGSTCYAFMAKGAKWKTLEDYLVSALGTTDVSQNTAESQMAAAIDAWENAAGAEIFGDLVDGLVDGADTVSTDEKNEVYFGAINEQGTIAVTIVWGFFSGPPQARELVEWDMVFDDEYLWGDAGPTSETDPGNTAVMDFLNIAVHEAGHAAGLDHPDGTCTEESMYAYAQAGETKKRTLEAGDIAGITELY